MDRPRLSLNEEVVLALLAERPSHGFALARELAAGSDVGRVLTLRRPLVYRALDRLVALGLAEPHATERGDAGPQRTVLRATDAGRAEVEAWLAEPVGHVRDLRVAFLAKVVLARRAGRAVGPLVRRQRSVLAPTFDALSTADPAADEVERWRHHGARSADAFLRDLERVTGIEPA